MNEVTINEMINLILRDGVNSKRQLVDRLSNLTRDDLLTLKRDIEVRLALGVYSK